MKVTSLIIGFVLISCGGRARTESDSLRRYDPELFESCLGEEEVRAEPVCVRHVNNLGRVSWSFPLAETEDLREMRNARSASAEAYPSGIKNLAHARNLAMRLIRLPERFRCNGNKEACRRVRRQVECESEVARAELADILFEEGHYLDAFAQVAKIVRAGPSHYRYKRVPRYLARLKLHIPPGVADVCLTQYLPPKHGKPKYPEWKPYTETDPPPEW